VTQIIVFDLDDTLYPERQFQFSGFKAVGDWLANNHGIEGFAAVASKVFEESTRQFVFNESLSRMRVPFNDDLIRELVKVFRSHTPEVQLFDDANWALDWANTNARLSALISDGYLEVQRNKVRVLGLKKRL